MVNIINCCQKLKVLMGNCVLAYSSAISSIANTCADYYLLGSYDQTTHTYTICGSEVHCKAPQRFQFLPTYSKTTICRPSSIIIPEMTRRYIIAYESHGRVHRSLVLFMRFSMCSLDRVIHMTEF